MLTSAHKSKCVAHLMIIGKKTLITDETAFQLFRNTITHWYKGSRPIRPTPKNRVKIFAWVDFV